jgi:hypothetical protein
MQWREPWRGTLQRQERLRLLTREGIRDAGIWSVTVIVVGGVAAIYSGTPISELAERAWIVPVVGVLMTAALSIVHWFSPLEVSSGPRGIVRAKGETFAVIPWDAIRSYRTYPHADGYVLELCVSYATRPEQLYMPRGVDLAAVELELRERTRRGV